MTMPMPRADTPRRKFPRHVGQGLITGIGSSSSPVGGTVRLCPLALGGTVAVAEIRGLLPTVPIPIAIPSIIGQRGIVAATRGALRAAPSRPSILRTPLSADPVPPAPARELDLLLQRGVPAAEVEVQEHTRVGHDGYGEPLLVLFLLCFGFYSCYFASFFFATPCRAVVWRIRNGVYWTGFAKFECQPDHVNVKCKKKKENVPKSTLEQMECTGEKIRQNF